MNVWITSLLTILITQRKFKSIFNLIYVFLIFTYIKIKYKVLCSVKLSALSWHYYNFNFKVDFSQIVLKCPCFLYVQKMALVYLLLIADFENAYLALKFYKFRKSVIINRFIVYTFCLRGLPYLCYRIQIREDIY